MLTDQSNKLSTAFGQTILGLRNTAKLTQLELALNVGIHRTYLSDIERGLRHPSILVMYEFAKAFGISASKLADLVDQQLFLNSITPDQAPPNLATFVFTENKT